MRFDLSKSLTEQQRRILWHIRVNGPTSRRVIARALGLHAGPITKLSRELISLGLLEEDEQVGGERGRPSIPLALAGSGGYAVGATVHPGWMEIVLVDFSGRLISRESFPFNDPDPQAFVTVIDKRLREVSSDRALMQSRFLGLGVAVPGPVTKWSAKRRQTVAWLRDWQTVDLPDFFSDFLGVPVFVENEATCAGLAEFYDTGLIRSHDSAIVFFLGHGVGAGVVSRRDIFVGEHGNAGEIGGQFPLDRPRPSGIDLLQTLQAAGAEVENLSDIENCLATHRDVIRAWTDRAAEQMSIAIKTGVGWIDPGAVVLSGGLPEAILAQMGDRIAGGGSTLEHVSHPTVEFRISRLGSWAAPIGAALIPVHQITANLQDSI